MHAGYSLNKYLSWSNKGTLWPRQVNEQNHQKDVTRSISSSSHPAHSSDSSSCSFFHPLTAWNMDAAILDYKAENYSILINGRESWSLENIIQCNPRFFHERTKKLPPCLSHCYLGDFYPSQLILMYSPFISTAHKIELQNGSQIWKIPMTRQKKEGMLNPPILG